jgi:hypothetical protein
LKRKLIAILLTICLFLCLVPLQKTEAASSVCFIATNDELLELSSAAYFQNATLYVPYNVFVKYFHIYNSYNAGASTATLYTSSRQIYFELDSGNTYDGSGEYYSTSALSLNGQIYVSVAFVCKQFGLTWSYITGTGYGDICRIRDGNAILSDSQFLSAASSLMETRYNAYTGSAPAPAVTGPSSGSGSGGESEGCDLYLSFQGMPSVELLDALRAYNVSTCFFVTADDVREAPDTVRRIVGEGHGIGVLCTGDPKASYDETAALIFEAARVNTVLIASASQNLDEQCAETAEADGLVFWRYTIDGVKGGAGISYASFVTAYLPYYTERADVRIQCCDATDGRIASVLAYMVKNNFNFRSVCEVGSPG